MLEFRVKAVEDTLKIVASAIEKQNANETLRKLVDQRVVAVEGLIETANKEIADLRRGNGFIQAPRRGTSAASKPLTNPPACLVTAVAQPECLQACILPRLGPAP
ncbi:hypothetical protein [Bradyrhizobium sp. USDA 3315]